MSELTAKENIKTADTVKRITATAVMAALTTLMTAYIFHIPVGVNGGYVHLGDTMIYLAAAFLPLPYACAAGAIGGGLADLLTAPVWAPATIIIKMLICLPFSSKGTKLVTKRNVVAYSLHSPSQQQDTILQKELCLDLQHPSLLLSAEVLYSQVEVLLCL